MQLYRIFREARPRVSNDFCAISLGVPLHCGTTWPMVEIVYLVRRVIHDDSQASNKGFPLTTTMILRSLCLLWLSFVVIPSVFAGEQVLLHNPRKASGNVSNGDSTTFTPVGDLAAIMETQYTVLSHPEFPRYNVRIKKSNFCDGTVKYLFHLISCASLVDTVPFKCIYRLYRCRSTSSVLLLL